jgi:hypothetical protein
VPALLAAILVATTFIATSVLAQDLPDTTPPVVKVTPSGVVGGMSGDLDSVINSTPSPRTFVLAAGTYPINSTIILNAGDNLRGPQVETATRGPAIYPVNPTADIVNGASLTRLIHMQGGNSEISWIEASGAIATDSNGLAATEVHPTLERDTPSTAQTGTVEMRSTTSTSTIMGAMVSAPYAAASITHASSEIHLTPTS